MASNRVVGTLSCFEVLARLSDYLDGDLEAADRAEVERHLAGCDECTRFGGEFAEVVTALRQRLGVGEEGAEGDDVPAEVAGRLDQALRS